MAFHVSLIGRRDLSAEIYRQVRSAIVDGRLRPGDRLPPSRELARDLSVSRATVTVAYERLAGEGFVASRRGAGTFVMEGIGRIRRRPDGEPSGGGPRARPIWDAVPLPTAFDRPARFDFRTGVPDGSLFPHRAWRRVMARALRLGETAAGVYAGPAGHGDLRAAIARHIGIARGVEATADDVVITNGTQQALDILTRVLVAPDEWVAFEDPGYEPVRSLFESLGARVAGVPVDGDGLVVDVLPGKVRLVYVTPSHQYPLGVALTLPRRRALLAWAERNHAVIVEDDYDSEFRFGGRPLEPLQLLDTAGRVVYVGSFSKTMLPTLRLGFLVAPRSLRPAIHKAKFVSDWHSATAAQAALAAFIDEGGFARHIRRVSAIYQARHERLARIIAEDFADHLDLIPSTTGLHLAAIARTKSVEEIAAIANRAADRDVAIQRWSSAAIGGIARAGVVLGYGAIAASEIAEGLRRLRQCFAV